MNGIRKEVRELISVNEKLQSAVVQGDQFSEDEAVIIRMCASELLATVGTPASGSSCGEHDGKVGQRHERMDQSSSTAPPPPAV